MLFPLSWQVILRKKPAVEDKIRDFDTWTDVFYCRISFDSLTPRPHTTWNIPTINDKMHKRHFDERPERDGLSWLSRTGIS